MRHLLLLILCLLAPAWGATTTSTTFSATGNGPTIQILPNSIVAMTGTYSITGSFTATLAWQYSPDQNNWTNLQTYTGTQAAITFANPGFYRWSCTAYTSGSPVGVIVVQPYVYQQINDFGGNLLFQVDTSGVTAVTAQPQVIPAGNQEAAYYQGNVNNYFELQVQNANSGSNASSDFVATANNGSATTHYVDMGINGSTGGAAPFTAANEAYVYSTDNILDLGAIGATGTINLAVGATPTTVLNVDYANGVSVNDVTTPSKRIRFNPSGATASTILTLAENQTTSQTLAFPNITGSDTLATLGLSQSWTGTPTFSNGITITSQSTINNADIVLGSSAGTRWATGSTQKQGWWGATPIVQPTGDVATALSTMGLIATPTISATSALDGTFTVNNTADGTKKFAWTLGNQTTGTTVTLNTGAQTASRTVSLPVLSGADTLMTLAVPGTSTGILSNSNATSATTSQTGAIVQNGGTAGTSVGIGAGNVNAGAAITAGTTVSSGTTMTAATGLTITNGNATFNNTGGTENLVVNGSTGNNSQITFQVNGTGETRWLGNTTDCQLFDIVNSFTALGYKMGASTTGYFYVNDTLDAGSGTGAIVDSGGIYIAKQAIVNGKATLGGATVPSANTFAGNIIWGRNTAAADTAGAVGETITGAFSGVAAAATTTTGNVGSVSLTAGKWLVSGKVVIHSGTTGLTAGTTIQVSCPVATAGTGTSGTTMAQETVFGTLVANSLTAISVDAQVVQITATTSEFLTCNITYGGGSPTIDGSITAVRLP